MLTKCTECQKDVSSEASSCPHCGYPIKAQPKDKDVPVVRESNPSKAKLGTFFIIIGIIGIIIGFIVIQPSDVEKIQGQLVGMTQDNQRTTSAFAGLTGDSSHTDQANQEVSDAKSELDKMVTDRQTKAACFFIPAGILFVLGLVLRSSAKPNS